MVVALSLSLSVSKCVSELNSLVVMEIQGGCGAHASSEFACVCFVCLAGQIKGIHFMLLLWLLRKHARKTRACEY